MNSAVKTLEREHQTKKNISTTVSPGLDPGVLEDFDEKKYPAISTLKSTMRRGYDTMEDILKRHNIQMKNQMNNGLRNASESRKFARTQIKNVIGAMDGATEKAQERIQTLEGKISSETKKVFDGWRFSQDTIKHVRDLKTTGKRMDFFNKRLQEGDFKAAASIVAAPHYITGLKKNELDGMRKQYRQKFFPDFVEEIKAVSSAVQRVNSAKKIAFEKINGDEIFDHAAIDRAESSEPA